MSNLFQRGLADNCLLQKKNLRSLMPIVMDNRFQEELFTGQDMETPISQGI
jgi:hypothetical protein